VEEEEEVEEEENKSKNKRWVRHYIYEHDRGEINFSALKFLWNSPLVLMAMARQVRTVENESKAVGSLPFGDYLVRDVRWEFGLKVLFEVVDSVII
jgi:hypothetical protein